MVSSSPIQQYKCFLKGCYDKVFPEQKVFTICNSKGAKQFINLALVHKTDCNHDVTRHSLLKQLHGNIDEIKKVKTPIAIHEVAVLPDNTMPRFILVEGAGARCWENNTSLGVVSPVERRQTFSKMGACSFYSAS